jgi:uncharacterized protein
MPITISEAVIKMIDWLDGNQREINHFLKVWAYARTIGNQEISDERSQRTLELAAIVHDIACPMLHESQGSAPGNLQEKFGPPMVREFYKGCCIDEEMLERICYLVAHHHTTSNVDGMDYQILLEADFLVNAGDDEEYRKAIPVFRKNVFHTNTGTALLNSIYVKK